MSHNAKDSFQSLSPLFNGVTSWKEKDQHVAESNQASNPDFFLMQLTGIWLYQISTLLWIKICRIENLHVISLEFDVSSKYDGNLLSLDGKHCIY